MVPNRTALLTNVPIQYYNKETMAKLRDMYMRPLFVMFRGPRAYRNYSVLGERIRPGQGICLKKDAKTFSVYAHYE